MAWKCHPLLKNKGKKKKESGFKLLLPVQYRLWEKCRRNWVGGSWLRVQGFSVLILVGPVCRRKIRAEYICGGAVHTYR